MKKQRKKIIKDYYVKNAKPVKKRIVQIKKETRMLLSVSEAYNIYICLTATKKIKGDVAEVGVYQGGSAKLIAIYKGTKALHLFDTFDGLPKPEKIDDCLSKGLFSAALETVKKYLKNYRNIKIYKGLFPKTADPVKNRNFSFVHLDVDLYRSTLECLKFFYPRMSRGGIILSHDYVSFKGVRKAFDKFFQDKPEPIIPLYTPLDDTDISNSQCLVVKI